MRARNILNKIIEYGFYLLFFLTPLLFNPSRQFPSYELFEWNKMMFVYAVTTILAGAWVLKLILLKQRLYVPTPFHFPLLLFFGSTLLSTLFSIDRHVSIFGYYSRFHGGLLSTFTYTTLYFVFIASRKQIKLKNIFLAALSSGTVIAIYGILEKFGIDAHLWVQDVQARVFSTLGQPNWLAALLAILLPVGIYQLLRRNIEVSTTQEVQSQNVQILERIKSPWIFLPILFYICLLFTKSRSGFLGFWIANILFLFAAVYSSRERSDSRSFFNFSKVSSRLSAFGGTSSNNIFTILLILNASFVVLNFFIRTPIPQYNRFLTVEMVQKNPAPVIEKPVTADSIIDVGITDSANIRKIVWEGAIDIAKNYPLFGTGPETFAFAYYKFRPVAHNLTSEWDFLYNRAHNEFLNIAATQGFLGLSLYLFLIVTVFFIAIKKFLKSTSTSTRLLIVALLASYISILITNFFGFSVVIVGIYFFLLPAMIYLPEDTAIKSENEGEKVSLGRKIGAGITLITVICILGRIGIYWVTDSYYARGYSASRGENYEDAYRYLVAATNLRPGEPVYHDERANVAAILSTIAFENNDATMSAQFAQEALSESSMALTTSPQNVNFWKSRTRILYQFTTFAPEFASSALESLAIAHELAPTDAKIAYNMAVLYGDTGKNQEAIKMLEKTIVLKPDYRDAYIALAIFYEKEKQKDKAREILELVLKRINPEDSEVKERIEELK